MFALCERELPDHGRLGLLGPRRPYDTGIWFPYFPNTSPHGHPLALVILESPTGHREGGAILDGDQVRIRLAGGQYIGRDPGGSATTVDQPSQSSVVTVCFNGENPDHPERAGEYLLETDELRFFLDWPGQAHNSAAFWVSPTGGGYLGVNLRSEEPALALSLRRGAAHQD